MHQSERRWSCRRKHSASINFNISISTYSVSDFNKYIYIHILTPGWFRMRGWIYLWSNVLVFFSLYLSTKDSGSSVYAHFVIIIIEDALNGAYFLNNAGASSRLAQVNRAARHAHGLLLVCVPSLMISSKFHLVKMRWVHMCMMWLVNNATLRRTSCTKCASGGQSMTNGGWELNSIFGFAFPANYECGNVGSDENFSIYVTVLVLRST